MNETASTSMSEDEITKEIAWALQAVDRVRCEVHKVIVGQDQVLEEVLLTMVCGGHAVVEGVPGLAKTLLISTLAKCLSLQFSRIQFTPDLMPSDITGTEVIEEDRSTGMRALRFVRGPIFANIVLADEINRTPPKTQAALLESMQERQVTVGGVTHRLANPFLCWPRKTQSSKKERTHYRKRNWIDLCSTFELDIQMSNKNWKLFRAPRVTQNMRPLLFWMPRI